MMIHFEDMIQLNYWPLKVVMKIVYIYLILVSNDQ